MHCGGALAGRYCTTLVAVDVATMWTELQALWGLHDQRVTGGIQALHQRLSFPLRAWHSDNGPECMAPELRQWLARLGARTLYIEPGSPWEHGYGESFNGTLRDECLNGELFYCLKEEQVVIEQWRVQYNARRPHSSLGYRPPAPAAYRPGIYANPLSQPMAVI